MHTINVIESLTFPCIAEKKIIKEYYYTITVDDVEALKEKGYGLDRRNSSWSGVDMLNKDECQVIIDRLRSQGIQAEFSDNEEDGEYDDLHEIMFPVTRMVYRPVLTDDDKDKLPPTITETYSDEDDCHLVSISRDIKDGVLIDSNPEYIYGALNTYGYAGVLTEYAPLFKRYDYQRVLRHSRFLSSRELNHITVSPGDMTVLTKIVGDNIQMDLVEIIPSSYTFIHTFSLSPSDTLPYSSEGSPKRVISVDGEMVFTTDKEDAVRALSDVNGMIKDRVLPASQYDVPQRKLYMCSYPVPMKISDSPPVSELVEKLSHAVNSTVQPDQY